jgi:hypothetical protein
MDWELHRKSAQIQHLQLQVRAEEINLERAKQKIVFLKDRRSEAWRNKAGIDPIATPVDSRFHNPLQDCEREPHGRRY